MLLQLAAVAAMYVTPSEHYGAFTHRMPAFDSVDAMRALVEDPIAYRITYKDGLRATMLIMNGTSSSTPRETAGFLVLTMTD